jgi:hypothetical protein
LFANVLIKYNQVPELPSFGSYYCGRLGSKGPREYMLMSGITLVIFRSANRGKSYAAAAGPASSEKKERFAMIVAILDDINSTKN